MCLLRIPCAPRVWSQKSWCKGNQDSGSAISIKIISFQRDPNEDIFLKDAWAPSTQHGTAGKLLLSYCLSSSGTAPGLLGCSGTLGSNTQYSGGEVAAAALRDGGCMLADPPEQEKGKCFLVCGLRSPAELKSVWPFAVVSNVRLCHPRTELRLSFLETAGDLPLEMPFFALDFAMIL